MCNERDSLTSRHKISQDRFTWLKVTSKQQQVRESPLENLISVTRFLSTELRK